MDYSTEQEFKKVYRELKCKANCGSAGSYTFTNGLTDTSGVVRLGGTLTGDTTIATDTYLLKIEAPSDLNTYIGEFGGLNQNWIRKDNSATNLSVFVMADLSGFGLDCACMFMGKLDFLGVPTTLIRVLPTTGNIGITATNDVSINATNDVSIVATSDVSLTATNNISSTATNDISIIAGAALNTNAEEGIYGGVNTDSGTTAGVYRIYLTKEVISATPSVVTELKRNQQYAMGIAIYDNPGVEQVSNIYYGVLNASNVITDISRVEASDQHSEVVHVYNVGSSYQNSIRVNSTGIVFDNNQFNNTITFTNRGYIAATIPSYLNDAAADADADLPSGGIYKLNAARALFVKP